MLYLATIIAVHRVLVFRLEESYWVQVLPPAIDLQRNTFFIYRLYAVCEKELKSGSFENDMCNKTF